MTKSFQFSEFKIENFKEKYKNSIVPKLKEIAKNVHLVPSLDKIVLNIRVSQVKAMSGLTTQKQKDVLERISDNLTLIAGQKPVHCAARSSNSNFGIREGDIVGMTVTLRKDRMFAFLEKLVYVALPRSKNFKGLKSSSFDKEGNFNLTVKSSESFPEGEISIHYPIQVTLVTKGDKNLGLAFLRELYLPIY